MDLIGSPTLAGSNLAPIEKNWTPLLHALNHGCCIFKKILFIGFIVNRNFSQITVLQKLTGLKIDVVVVTSTWQRCVRFESNSITKTNVNKTVAIVKFKWASSCLSDYANPTELVLLLKSIKVSIYAKVDRPDLSLPSLPFSVVKFHKNLHTGMPPEFLVLLNREIKIARLTSENAKHPISFRFGW